MFSTIDKRKTGIQLRKIMDRKGFSVKDIQEYLGLGSVQSIYHWLNGISMPTIDNLYALSELLQVPMDAIVQGSRAPITPDVSFKLHTARERRLCAYYKRIIELQAA